MTRPAPAMPASARKAISNPRDIPLLVLSFDGYEDLWNPFFAFFWKQWPDCPFRVFLSTNFKTYQDTRVTSLHTGEEVSWATRLRRSLESLNTEYVLLVLEDFLFTAPVDTRELVRLGQVALDERVACLRLAPNPSPSAPVAGHPDLGVIHHEDPYRVTSQVAFWHVDSLLAFLEPQFSIWEFEFRSSIHGPRLERPMWARWEPALQYQHCVQRGKWLPWGVETCRAAGVPIDLAARREMEGAILWRHRMHEFKSSFFWLLPRNLRRRRWARIVARETSARGAKSGALAVPRSDSSR